MMARFGARLGVQSCAIARKTFPIRGAARLATSVPLCLRSPLARSASRSRFWPPLTPCANCASAWGVLVKYPQWFVEVRTNRSEVVLVVSLDLPRPLPYLRLRRLHLVCRLVAKRDSHQSRQVEMPHAELLFRAVPDNLHAGGRLR